MDFMNEIMKKTLEASKPIESLNPALIKIIDNGIMLLKLKYEVQQKNR